MEGDTSENAGPKSYLAACLLALQQAETDTEKFAALLMVAKLVQAQDCSAGDKRQILDAVGFPFLVRLLRTKEVPEGCSLLIFKSVAVSVLSAVMGDPSVASDKQMSLVIPYLKEILEMALIDSPEEEREMLQEMARDTCSIASQVACTAAGDQVLRDLGFPGLLVQILDSKPDEEAFVMTQTLLVLLLWQCGTKLWTGPHSSFDRYLQVLGRCISDCENKSFINLCELTTHMLNYMPENMDSEACIMSLHPLLNKLSSVIRTKLGVPERKVVLSLMNQLAVCCGVQCLLPPVFPDHKVFLLQLHLTCVEVRMAVENVTEEQVKQCASELCLHYNMLETALDFLCKHDESQGLPLQADMFCQAHDALLGAVHGVFHFLQQVDSGALVMPLLDPVTVASVRLIAAISCQAFSEVKENIMSVLPFLVRLCETEVGTAATSTAADADTNQRGDGKGPPSANEIAGQTAEPTTDHVTNAGDSAPSQDRQPCTCVSGKLTRLQISSHDEAQSVESLSSTDATDTESTVSTPKCEACSCQETMDSRRSHSEESKRTSEPVSRKTSEGVDNPSEGTEGANAGLGSHSAGCEPDGQGGQRAPQPVSVRATGVLGGETTLPRTLGELTKWVCHRSEGATDQLPCLEVIKFLVPVLELVCEDEDTKRLFLELRGPTALVHFLTHRLQPALRSSSAQEMTTTDCQVLAVLLQLLMLDEELGQSEPFTRLMHTALTALPLLDAVPELYVYKAHWVAAGLSLLRVTATQHKTCNEEQISKFLGSTVVYLCQAPISTPGAAGEKETGSGHWQEVQDMWTLALENLTGLISSFPELADLLLKQKFLQTAASVLKTGQGSILKKENAAAVKEVVKTLAERDHKARELVEQMGGTELTT